MFVADFKPRLEKLLADIVLVSEIANLAVEADAVAKTIAESPSADNIFTEEDASSKKEEAKALLASVAPKENKTTRKNIGFADVKFDESILSLEHVDQLEEDQDHAGQTFSNNGVDRRLHVSPSGSLLIKNQLERWEEPISKHDKVKMDS